MLDDWLTLLPSHVGPGFKCWSDLRPVCVAFCLFFLESVKVFSGDSGFFPQSENVRVYIDWRP